MKVGRCWYWLLNNSECTDKKEAREHFLFLKNVIDYWCMYFWVLCPCDLFSICFPKLDVQEGFLNYSRAQRIYYCIIDILLLVANSCKVRFFMSCYELGLGVKQFLLWIYWFIGVGKINSQGQSLLGLCMCDVMVTCLHSQCARGFLWTCHGRRSSSSCCTAWTSNVFSVGADVMLTCQYDTFPILNALTKCRSLSSSLMHCCI